MNILNTPILRRNVMQTMKKNRLPLLPVKNVKMHSLNTQIIYISSVKTQNSFVNVHSKRFSFYNTKKNNFSQSKKIFKLSDLPRHVVLTMPNLSPTMTQGNIVAWNKKEGDAIKSGESLASIETDKAQVDFEVNEDGFVAKIFFPEGTKDVKIGTPVAIIVEEKSDLEAFKNYTPGAKSEQPKAQPQQTQQIQQPQQTNSSPTKSYPRHMKLTMPNLSPTMTKGNIVEWRKKEGDAVKPGDVLANIETDKAQVDFEMNEEGFVAKLLYPSGSKDVNVGSLVAILVEDKKDVEAFKDYTGETTHNVSQTTTQTTSQSSSQSSNQETSRPTSSSQNERVFASPFARKTAREIGLELQGIQGSGPNGRIIQSDVLHAKETSAKESPRVSQTVQQEAPQVKQPSQPTQPIQPAQPSVSLDYEDLEITGIRKVTAERLTFSKSNIPHFYISMDCNVDKLSALRTELNKHSPVKLSFNDIVIKAASLACMKVPETNSSWQGNVIRKFKNVDMSVAVQTDYGLITPIITSSNLKGLSQISKEMKDLAERAKARKLKPQEFQGGTFTISNMGMMGISNFTAVINPPQACILAVGKSEKRILYDENAKDKNAPYKVATMMSCTLSCDHRVVDGAFGAMWVQEFKNLIENPELMLL